MNLLGQASFEFVFSVGAVLFVFVISILGLTGFDFQADKSVEVLSNQVECEKVLTLAEAVYGKQGKNHSTEISVDVNVHENFIEVSDVKCFPSFPLQEASLSPGLIKAEFDGVNVIVSNYP
jgi:hypothetical protein